MYVYPILEFDSNPSAIIEPSKLIAKRPDFPSICISTFSGKIIEKLSQMNSVAQICRIHNANGEIPIYQIDYENTPIAFYLSPIGSAAAATDGSKGRTFHLYCNTARLFAPLHFIWSFSIECVSGPNLSTNIRVVKLL